MVCCGLGLALIAAARGLALAKVLDPAALGVAAAAALGGAALAAEHLGHYEARAEAHDRSLIAEILAAPICHGR